MIHVSEKMKFIEKFNHIALKKLDCYKAIQITSGRGTSLQYLQLCKKSKMCLEEIYSAQKAITKNGTCKTLDIFYFCFFL